MKRFFAASVALGLAAALVHIPSASAAAGLSQQQADEITASYMYLTQDFYQRVDAQNVLNSAHAAILALLKTDGVKDPKITEPRASSDDVNNVRELQREADEAVTHYSGKVSATKVAYAAISGVVGSVKDRYTVFLDPKSFAELNEGLDGTSFGGVGLTYSIDDQTKNIRVENVIIDGPSDKAGLRGDDEISAINDRSVKDIIAGAPLDVQQSRIQKLLRGDPGTKVKLAIVRNDATIDPVTVTRDTIKPPSVFAKLLPGDIGYAQLSVFGQNTGSELNAALNRLQSQGAKAYVLDLRYNGGGYLNAAVDVSSKFIPTGPIVTVRSRAGQSTEYDAENIAIAPRPLAVLVNGYTASASEITAGAIEDSGVGTLIGTKTFGKGVVQTIFPLRDGSAVKITTARYYTPDGHDINTIGIQPQIEADIPKGTKIRPGYPEEDPQLTRAIAFLQQKIAGTAAAGTTAATTVTPIVH
ncbi:MAG: S41 family peptidase [Candidatus Lustribacter sp.]|jgi:carboxyl-terminal processing protease